jgi:hypothetical protein
MELDEAGTLQAFKTIRTELFEPTTEAHNGRLVKTTGDGFLLEFSSVVDALRCAVEMQAHTVERNATVPMDSVSTSGLVSMWATSQSRTVMIFQERRVVSLVGTRRWSSPGALLRP